MRNRFLSRLPLILTSLGIICFLTYLNDLTPLFADDFSYSVSFVTKQPFHSVKEVLESQYLHYYSTNGRSVVHTLAQLLLWMGKPGLNLCNGIAFWGLCMMICYHAIGRFSRIRAVHLALVFGGLWFLTPHFGGSYLWVMGAANYLYSPLMILLYLIPYRQLFSRCKRSEPAGPLFPAIWFLGGILAGWSNENTCLALLAIQAAGILILVLQHRRIPAWVWTGLVGSVLGCALLFLSPAQAKRLAGAGGMGGPREWMDRLVLITKQAVRYLIVPALLFLAGMIRYLHRTRKDSGRLRLRELSAGIPALLFLLGTGIAVYSMVGSPFFPVWTWSSILAFSLIAALSIWHAAPLPDSKPLRHLLAAAALLLTGAAALRFFSVKPELDRVRSEFRQREALIAEAAETQSPLRVTRIHTDCTYSSYSLFEELSADPEIWPNTAVSNYYQIPGIAAEPD